MAKFLLKMSYSPKTISCKNVIEFLHHLRNELNKRSTEDAYFIDEESFRYTRSINFFTRLKNMGRGPILRLPNSYQLPKEPISVGRKQWQNFISKAFNYLCLQEFVLSPFFVSGIHKWLTTMCAWMQNHPFR